MHVVRRGAALLAMVLVAFGLTACEPERTYTYRIATRGPVTADVGHFGRHVAQTLNDPRGWSLGGSIAFRQTTGPADFTIWLSTAGNVPSFSSACSSQWSCRVGPNVVINETRWQHASPRWPYGVDSYRHYVVNHEVGHWLGLGHQTCGGRAGDRAQVMVQQSKGGAALGACRFNVWPTPPELQTVARVHRVGVRPTGLPSPDDPFGHLDRVRVIRHANGAPDRIEVAGWAIDGDSTAPLAVVINVDGQPMGVMRADRSRPDVARVHPRYGPNHGFEASMDIGGSSKVICLDALGVGAGARATTLGCSVVK